MILEIGKSYVDRFYNGDLCECVRRKDGNAWTQEKILKCFKSEKRFNEYIKENKKYSFFVSIQQAAAGAVPGLDSPGLFYCNMIVWAIGAPSQGLYYIIAYPQKVE